MTKKEAMAAIKAHVQTTFGSQYSDALFKQAKAKAAVWQRNAYGHTDWIQHVIESDSVPWLGRAIHGSPTR